MGNACAKQPNTETKKRNLLLAARYSLPASILIEANGVEKAKLAEFEALFKKLDEKTKQTVEVKKIAEALQALSHQFNEEDMKTLYQNAGVEADDRINFDYFVKIILGFIRRADPEAEMKEAFRVFDKDGNGMIVADEVRSVMKWSDSAIAKFIRGADKNGDGMVDYNEFIRLLVECDDMDFN